MAEKLTGAKRQLWESILAMRDAARRRYGALSDVPPGVMDAYTGAIHILMLLRGERFPLGGVPSSILWTALRDTFRGDLFRYQRSIAVLRDAEYLEEGAPYLFALKESAVDQAIAREEARMSQQA